MKTKQLIEQLQHIVDVWEPLVPSAGEHTVKIDSFSLLDKQLLNIYKFDGESADILVEESVDGAECILSQEIK